MTGGAMQECYGCDQPIEWKTNKQTGKRQRFNPDGSSHYCKECQYCNAMIEWRNNVYVDIADKERHQCDEYKQAMNKGNPSAEIKQQQEEQKQRVPTAKEQGFEDMTIQDILKNIGISIGELTMAVKENTRAMRGMTEEEIES